MLITVSGLRVARVVRVVDQYGLGVGQHDHLMITRVLVRVVYPCVRLLLRGEHIHHVATAALEVLRHVEEVLED